MEDIGNKFLCIDCVGDKYLKKFIEDDGQTCTCTFCNSTRICLEITDVAEEVDQVLHSFYTPAQEYPVPDSKSDKVYWELGGEHLDYLLAELMQVEIEVAEEILRTLAEKHGGFDPDVGFFYTSEDKYELLDIGPIEFSYIWRRFCYSIKHLSRFFDEGAEKSLKRIFSDLDAITTVTGISPIVTITEHDHNRYIFRARRADDVDKLLNIYLRPRVLLGPPPPEVTRAGRMNPSGIPVFYGAFDIDTCIAEIRAPVGGIVAVGKFEIIRPVRILDLTILEMGLAKTSPFNPDYVWDSDRKSFLTDFHREIRKPILPREESLEYVPTQAVVEFLANDAELDLDGIIFSSIQSSGKNIALFNHAIQITETSKETLSIESESEYEAVLDEFGFHIRMRADEDKPQFKRSIEFGPVILEDIMRTGEEWGTEREPTLQYVPNSLELHKVRSVSLLTEWVTIFTPERESQED